MVSRQRLRVLAVVTALVAVAGWIWALSNSEMPDTLWLLTVALSIVAIVLSWYAFLRERLTTSTR